MVLLQICLLPLTVLFLLGAIFAIGSAGLGQPRQSTWMDQDDAWVDKRISSVTAGSIHLPGQLLSFNRSGKQQVDLPQTEISQDYSIRESLPELLIFKH
jgi:hypothetical protein